MNDYEYVFKSDAAEKKRNGRGAFNKKGGGKSKKCTLPGDYLTPAQKKKLSKTIVDVNLREPMTWYEFKALSSDIQKEYLIFLRDRFGVSLRDISSDLFGHAPQFLSNKSCGEFSHLKGIFPKKPKARTDVQIHRWRLWLGKDIPEAEISGEEPFEIEKTDKFFTYRPKLEKVAREGEIDVSDIKIKDDPPESEDQPKRHGRFPWGEDLDASSLSMTFDKTCSYEDICEKLRFILMAQSNGRNVTQFEFTVKFE